MKKLPSFLFIILLFNSASAFAINIYNRAYIAYQDNPVVLDVLQNSNGVDVSTLTTFDATAGLYSRDAHFVWSFAPYPADHAGNNGYLLAVADGKVQFQAAPGYTGSFRFFIRAGDGNGNTAESWHLVHVQPVNRHADVTVPDQAHIRGHSFSNRWTPQVIDAENDPIDDVSISVADQSIIRLHGSSYNSDEVYVVGGSKGVTTTTTTIEVDNNPQSWQLDTLVFVHGRTPYDKSLSHTLPAISQSYQPQTLSYFLSHSNPYHTSDYNSELAIELEGDLTLGALPDNCNGGNAGLYTGKIIRCNVNVPQGQTIRVDIPITAGAAGVIQSRASLPIDSHELRKFDNLAEGVIPVVDQILATTNGINSGISPGAVLLLDINNDQLDDLLIASRNFERPRWFINDGSGGFTAGNHLFAPIKVMQIIQGDLDNDDNLDIVLLGQSGEFHQYEKSGQTLVLRAAHRQWSRNNVHAGNAIIADLNNDMNGELYVAAGNYLVRFKNSNGLLTTPASDDWLASDISSSHLASGQLRATQAVELLANNFNSNTQLLSQTGSNLQQADFASDEGHYFQQLLVDDFDGNNFDDVLRVTKASRQADSGYHAYTPSLLEQRALPRINQLQLAGNNNYVFSSSSGALLPEVEQLMLFDLDNDQDNEVLVKSSTGALLMLLNDQGNLQLVNYGLSANSNDHVQTGRLTNDDTTDLVIVEDNGQIKTLLISAVPAIPSPPVPDQVLIIGSNSGGGVISYLWLALWSLLAMAIWHKKSARTFLSGRSIVPGY